MAGAAGMVGSARTFADADRSDAVASSAIDGGPEALDILLRLLVEGHVGTLDVQQRDGGLVKRLDRVSS